MTKYSFKYTDPAFFTGLIRELPSFKPAVSIQSSAKIDKLTTDLNDFLGKVYQVEKNAMLLIDKINNQMKGLCASLTELSSAFSQMEKVKAASRKHNLGYDSEISSAYPKIAEFVKVIETDVANHSKFFDSSLVRYLKYQHYEYKNFSEYCKRTKWVKNSLQSLQSGLSTHDKQLNEKLEGLKVFRAFVNQMTHYNFKQLYIKKNQKLNEKIEQAVDEYAVFLADVT